MKIVLQCCRALAHAVNSNTASPNYIVPRILHLENFSCGTGRSEWQWPSGDKMSVLDFVMLQIIFNYSSNFIQQFCSSFASMEIDHILEDAKDLMVALVAYKVLWNVSGCMWKRSTSFGLW